MSCERDVQQVQLRVSQLNRMKSASQLNFKKHLQQKRVCQENQIQSEYSQKSLLKKSQSLKNINTVRTIRNSYLDLDSVDLDSLKTLQKSKNLKTVHESSIKKIIQDHFLDLSQSASQFAQTIRKQKAQREENLKEKNNFFKQINVNQLLTTLATNSIQSPTNQEQNKQVKRRNSSQSKQQFNIKLAQSIQSVQQKTQLSSRESQNNINLNKVAFNPQNYYDQEDFVREYVTQEQVKDPNLEKSKKQVLKRFIRGLSYDDRQFALNDPKKKMQIQIHLKQTEIQKGIYVLYGTGSQRLLRPYEESAVLLKISNFLEECLANIHNIDILSRCGMNSMITNILKSQDLEYLQNYPNCIKQIELHWKIQLTIMRYTKIPKQNKHLEKVVNSLPGRSHFINLKAVDDPLTIYVNYQIKEQMLSNAHTSKEISFEVY